MAVMNRQADALEENEYRELVHRAERVLKTQPRRRPENVKDQLVWEALQRCNQENLLEQLKNGVDALRAPVNTLHANWAYMVMVGLAWSLKAWKALPLHPCGQAQHLAARNRILSMKT